MYGFAVLTVLITFGLLVLIPPFVLIAIFQVNTWTLIIMRYLLLKDQTYLARKIDETYRTEALSVPRFLSYGEEDRFSILSFCVSSFQFLIIISLSVFPVVPQMFMVPSIGWQYLNAIYLPNEPPSNIYWENTSSYIGFGLVASLLEATPFISGLAFTSNYLGGTIMALEMNHITIS